MPSLSQSIAPLSPLPNTDKAKKKKKERKIESFTICIYDIMNLYYGIQMSKLVKSVGVDHSELGVLVR